MRTHAETAALLHEVSYPGFQFELMWTSREADRRDLSRRHGNSILSHFSEKAIRRMCAELPPVQDARLRVTCPEALCNVTGAVLPKGWNGRWWRLSEHMTDSEIVWTCWAAVQMALLHEAREKFTFKGVPIADSHVDVHKLADFMAQPSVKDGRS